MPNTSGALTSPTRASSTSRVTAARKTPKPKPPKKPTRKTGAAKIRAQGGKGKAVKTWKGLSQKRRDRIKRRVNKRGGSLVRAVRTIQRRRRS